MSWKLCLSLVALCAALAAAGCRGDAENDPIRAESLRKRLDNQARAIVIMEVENGKLRRRIEDLKMENARLAEDLNKLRGAGKKEMRKP